VRGGSHPQKHVERPPSVTNTLMVDHPLKSFEEDLIEPTKQEVAAPQDFWVVDHQSSSIWPFPKAFTG
jgi:hypothetical protein